MGYFIIEYLGYPCMNLLQIINILGNIQSLNGIWSVFLNYKIWCSQDWFFENVTLVSISSFLSRIFKFEVVTLFRTLLLNYSANFRLVLLLWLFYSQKTIFGNFEMSQDLLFLMNMSLSTKVYDTEIPVSTYMRTPIWQTEISWQERCRNFFLCPTILKTVQTAIFYTIYQKGFLLFLIHFCSD